MGPTANECNNAMGTFSNRRRRLTAVGGYPTIETAGETGSKRNIFLGRTFLLCLALVSLTTLVNRMGYSLLSQYMSPVIYQSFKQSLGEHTSSDRVSVVDRQSPKNVLCIFTGRWEFLRINFAYIYRSLRANGGVLDKVYYIMIKYDEKTLSTLTKLVETANGFLGQEVFEFRFMNHNKNKKAKMNPLFNQFYFEIFDELVTHPDWKYFKMDDDIVYIHPDTFRQFIDKQNTSECFIHFANIGGANWRSSYIHQEMGIYDNPVINPKKLKFQFNPGANCGWKSAACAEVALRAFLYHYENRSLERFVFDGRYLTPDRSRYSINFFMLDVNLIDLKAMLDSGPMKLSDELWWTVNYSRRVKHPNCVVGGAFVVHFSYFINRGEIMKRGFLRKFEIIAYKNLVNAIPEVFQTILGFNKTVGA